MTRLGEKPLRSRKSVYVLDATPIIHFAKVEKLGLALDICEAHITREVYRESVEEGRDHPDAIVIRNAVNQGEFKLYDVRDRGLVKALQRHPEIRFGEAETLAAAKELNAPAVVDEAEARAIAKTYVIQTRAGTLFLLFRIFALRQIEATECLKVLDQLIESGLYVDAHTLMRARQNIDGFRRSRK